MLDMSLPVHSTTCPARFAPVFAIGDADPIHPFALTLSRRTPADLMSGRAAPLVLARFATLADAMLGAIDHAEGMATHTPPQFLATATSALCWPGPPATAPSRGVTQ